MLRQFYPWEYVSSVFAIDYDKLYELGYRGLLFDIDNTLVPHGTPSTPEVDALFARLREKGFACLMLSNNGVQRITSFLEQIEADYIDNAGKPDPTAYHQAVQRLGLKPEQVLMIGDQVFTDIRGANRASLASILVEFIGAKTEKHWGKRRRAEQLILLCYRFSRARHRLGGITKREEA